MNKQLPGALTSYDFLKALALVLMIVDHVGYYFYPQLEYDWIRAVGRLSAPIWLFLIGYAQSRDLSPRMWIAMGVLAISQWVFGQQVMPLNILATMLVLRMLIDPVMGTLIRQPKMFYPLVCVIFFLTFPTAAVLEYGSIAMMYVMLGYMVRNRETMPYNKSDLVQFAVIAALTYGFYQVMIFFMDFSMPEKVGVVAGLTMLSLFLLSFRPYTFEDLTQRLPSRSSGRSSCSAAARSNSTSCIFCCSRRWHGGWASPASSFSISICIRIRPFSALQKTAASRAPQSLHEGEGYAIEGATLTLLT